MAVTVKVGGAIRRLLDGRPEAKAEGATVGQVLEHLKIRDQLCNDQGELRPYLIIYIDGGKDIRLLQGLATPVDDGDTIFIFYAVGGG